MRENSHTREKGFKMCDMQNLNCNSNFALHGLIHAAECTVVSSQRCWEGEEYLKSIKKQWLYYSSPKDTYKQKCRNPKISQEIWI